MSQVHVHINNNNVHRVNWSCTTRIFPSLLVLPTEEWQQDNMQSSVVTGDKNRLG